MSVKTVLHIIDSHTHLDSESLIAEQDAVVARANAAGVTKIITIGASSVLQSAHRAVALTEKYHCVWASVGVHPHDAGSPFSREELLRLARHPKVVAIGETGLDFYRDWAPKEKQYEAFITQIELALEVNKPIVIHSRDAGEECLRILKEYNASKVGGVFHCFAEDAEFATRLRDIHFRVSFPGTLTFKKADALRDICNKIPFDQILVETDAPYMAPEPYRGKRCEPAFVAETLRKLAEIKGVTFEEAAAITTHNTLTLFKGIPNDQG